MRVGLLFDPFGGRWSDVHAGALAAEDAGFDGVWLYDHLAGSVHRAQRVLECWTWEGWSRGGQPGVVL